MKYDYSARTHVGQQRGRNEDSLVAQVVNTRFIGAVADGMGGHQAGEKASRLAVEAIKEAAPELAETQAVSEVLVAAVQAANQNILEASLRDQQLAGMGTTLTGAVVEPGRAWLAHVGDSRAYLLRHGQIAQLTADHSLVEELVRRGHLSESEAQIHPQRNLLLQALG
jgi:serine/threonine protein phosphatase PrpC